MGERVYGREGVREGGCIGRRVMRGISLLLIWCVVCICGL